MSDMSCVFQASMVLGEDPSFPTESTVSGECNLDRVLDGKLNTVVTHSQYKEAVVEVAFSFN